MDDSPEPETPLARTLRVDDLVRGLWPGIPGVSLVAVGGYGRSELFPYSDVDLLLLSGHADLKADLAPFLRSLWDAGLRASQSLHTPEECNAIDSRNIELSISLLDRRFLTGDPALFAKLRDAPREQLAPALAALTRERHSKYGNTIYHLEPNVKEGPGALRDLQVLRWLAQLDNTEPPAFPHALLFRLRSLLHVFARRDQNVLNFAMQDACAARLGIEGPAELMRDYYRQAAPLYRACVRRLDQAETRRSPLFAALRDRAARLSNSEFSVIHGQVFLRMTAIDSGILARLFAFVARHGLPLARDTEERVRQHPPAAMSWTDLRAIFNLPHADLAARAMHNTGVFVTLFPDLQCIESLVIRDYYHRYTVDEHTLVAIEAAVKLREAASAFGELSRETPDYPLLLLALLFHDAGKGVPSEAHAVQSVEIAARACAQMQVSPRETETVLFLIGAHLEMSRLMLTRDVSDSGTAALLIDIVQTMERLKLLTLLTSAISAR